MDRVEALRILRDQGGHAFLTPKLAQEIADAFGLGPIELDEIKAPRGMPTRGIVAANLAAQIADSFPGNHDIYNLIDPTLYNVRALAALGWIDQALGLTWSIDERRYLTTD